MNGMNISNKDDMATVLLARAIFEDNLPYILHEFNTRQESLQNGERVCLWSTQMTKGNIVITPTVEALMEDASKDVIEEAFKIANRDIEIELAEIGAILIEDGGSIYLEME